MASTSTSSNSGAGDPSKDKESRWYFTAEQLANSPSRRHGIDTDQELSFRQLTAYLIQEMGQRLQVSQLCINTAIVYMHRFYAFHSFTRFHRNGIAAASLFLAAKVEEQPRKLEHVIKVSHMCLNQEAPHPSTEAYAEQAQDLVFNENVLLQTLGFDVAIDHPHTHVVKTCHLVKACKDLAQTSYFLASNSLHLTSMCLQYRPTVVACFCIYLACKWSRWEIPQSTEGKHWFHYVDKGVTMDLLKQLTDEFIAIYEKSPARLKSKLNSIKALAQGARITEPPRNLSDSSNGSSSQMPQMEAARRPESYSSHHRSHHSSSHASVSHHHHSKQPPAGELSEHKAAVSHKQPYPPTAGTHSNRPRSDRSQVPNESQYSVPAHSSNKQLPIPSNSRPSSSSRPGHGVNLTGSSSSSQQRIPHSHDLNYHKSRGSMSTQVNPTLPSHKIPPKNNDSSRNVLQESSGRTVDPGKIHAKHNSCNMYPPLNPPNSAGTEATRNIIPQQGSIPIQQQRTFIPPSSYNQLVSNRSSSNSSSSSSSSSSNNNSNVKYEQSVQQQTHMHLNQKQSVESSFSTTNTRQLDDGMKLADQMEICSPTKYSSYPQQLQSFPLAPQQPQQTHSQSKPVSIFSPEWNEKPVIPATAVCNNNSNSNGSSKPLGLSIKSKDKDSPKKSERDKRSETPKKEKLRTEMQIQEPSKTSSSADKKFLPPTGGVSKKNEATLLTNQNVPQIMPFDVKVKQELPLNYSSSKRPANNEASVSRTQEDEGFRESKIRKVETQSPPKFSEVKSSLPPLYEQQTTGETRSVKSFPATINGIETNPDLVSSLLKESLCSDSKFTATALIKTESKDTESLTTVDQLTNLERVPQQILQTDIPIKQEALSPSDDHIKTKSEKKKKKDKHKHKEKDKVKDKEERKKHKKDKDRHKDKDKERIIVGSDSVEQNPVKIKISKDKLNLPLLDPLHPPTSGFKIKIPKDRIKGELSNFQPEESCNPLPLKIKISKDKIEVREMSQETTGTGVYSSSTVSHSHSSGNSSSSKKKDKDRDREKEKRRSGSDYNKQNGNSLVGSGGSAGSSSKSQSSSASKEII